jgi:DNA-binding XRE family transcriptional regulator
MGRAGGIPYHTWTLSWRVPQPGSPPGRGPVDVSHCSSELWQRKYANRLLLVVSECEDYKLWFYKHQSIRMKACEIVAWNVRQLRVRQGMSSETLAASAGVDRSYLGRLERGHANPTIEVLERLASILKIEIGELFIAPLLAAKFPSPLPAGRARRNG